MGVLGQRRRRQGVRGVVKEREWGPSLAQGVVRPYPVPWHGARADALGEAGPPGQGVRQKHCSGVSKLAGVAGLASHEER